MLGDVAIRAHATGITLSMDEVMSANPSLLFYFQFFTAENVTFQGDAIDPPIDHNALHNLLGYVDVNVGDYTFLTLFDSPIKTRVDTQGKLVFDCGPRNVRDCVVGDDRNKVRAKGHAIYEQYGEGYGDDWLAIGSINEIIESSSKPS